MIRAALKEGTATQHEALEGAMPLARPAPGRADYVAHLALLHGVHAPLEPLLAAHLPATLQDRAKAPLLRADLVDLGVDPDALPRADVSFFEPDEAFAMGCLYVLEGAALGGTVIRRRLEREAPWFAGAPQRFLAVGTSRWPAFLAALEERCAGRGEVALRGAQATFAALQRLVRPPGGA